MTPLSAADLLLSVIGVASLYSCMLVIYRLYLSPLSKFPGPRLAAATLWYEFYYDVIKHGRYTWKLAELHAEYGAAWPQTNLASELADLLQALSSASARMSCISMTLSSLSLALVERFES